MSINRHRQNERLSSESHFSESIFLIMLFLTLIALILLTAQQDNVHDVFLNSVVTGDYWKAYKDQYKLTFDEIEDKKRKETFVHNLLKIESHNQKNLGFKLKMNKFGHLTENEFKKRFLSQTNIKALSAINSVKGAKSIVPVDYRKKNVVNPIKNQKDCGSSYAFSAIASVESAVAMKTGKLIQLSEQDVLDCSGDYGTKGCFGGTVDSSFKYMVKQGITSEKDYPYTSIHDYCIRYDYETAANISGYVDIESGDESALTDVVVTKGPVSVMIVGSTHSFRFYSSGVYFEPLCKNMSLDLFVAVVGVTDECYIVRNSWGSEWGDEGYICMARNKDNNCGIASAASYPIA